MKILFIILSLLLVPAIIFSQESKFSKHGSQIQMDVLGPGGMLSFHFESRFLKSKTGIGYKIGLGTAPYDLLEESCNEGGNITIPLGLNYLIGEKSHLLEIGAGNVFKFGSGTMIGCTEIEDSFFENGNVSYLYCLLGYRYQPPTKRISWRIFVSPLFQKDVPVKFWGGAGVSLKFGSAK